MGATTNLSQMFDSLFILGATTNLSQVSASFFYSWCNYLNQTSVRSLTLFLGQLPVSVRLLSRSSFLGQLTAFPNFSQVFVSFFILGATTKPHSGVCLCRYSGGSYQPQSGACLCRYSGGHYQPQSGVCLVLYSWGNYQPQSGICRYSGGSYVTSLSQVFVVILGATTLPASFRYLPLFWGQLRYQSQSGVCLCRYSGGNYVTNLSQVFVVILGATTLPASVRCLSLFWGQLRYQPQSGVCRYSGSKTTLLTSVRCLSLSLFWGQVRYQPQSGICLCRYSGGKYVTSLSQVFVSVVILGTTTNLSQVFVVILGTTTLPASVRCLPLFWGQLRYQPQSDVCLCRYSGGNYQPQSDVCLVLSSSDGTFALLVGSVLVVCSAFRSPQGGAEKQRTE